jgi:hypothetical protein
VDVDELDRVGHAFDGVVSLGVVLELVVVAAAGGALGLRDDRHVWRLLELVLERLVVRAKLRLNLRLRVEVTIDCVTGQLVDVALPLFLVDPIAVVVRGGHGILLSAGTNISG